MSLMSQLVARCAASVLRFGRCIGSTLVVSLLASTMVGVGTASAARTISSVPHVERFDTNSYASNIVWATAGCTHTWVSTGGWRGGAAKFTPPTAGEGYCGLGQFMVGGVQQVAEQINVRFLIYHGSTWNTYGPTNKLIIMNRDGNRGRPMVITQKWTGSGTPWETWGACDGTVCRYQEGNFWPEGGDDLRIGNPPNAREQEWISVEFEANTRTGRIRLYVTSEDGDLNGLYVERGMDDTGTGGRWSYVDIIGGYMNAGAQVHPDNYFLIDEVAIDSRYIGPPEGFGNTTRPDPPASLQVQ